jgi:hypothetical protein
MSSRRVAKTAKPAYRDLIKWGVGERKGKGKGNGKGKGKGKWKRKRKGKREGKVFNVNISFN